MFLDISRLCQIPPISEIAASDVISEGMYEHIKTPFLGLGLNFSYFGLFVPGSIHLYRVFGVMAQKQKIFCTQFLQI